MAKMSAIEGIGPVYAAKLAEADVTTTEGLLKKTGTPADRKKLSETTGIESARILAWANRADLFRIKGIGEEWSDLLEAAGVDTVPALAQRNAENFHAKIVETNEAQKLVRRTPTAKQVANWIEQAQALPRVLNY